MKSIGIFTVLLLALLSSMAQANELIQLDEFGIKVIFPEKYRIIPSSQWKTDLAFSQQFIMKNPFDFDYLIQKIGNKEKGVIPFETSYFLIKIKRTREITKKEFKNYIINFFLNWEEVIKERQKKGLLSNLLKSKVIQLPIVDYEKKTVIFKASMQLGEIKETQFMYSAFYSSGNFLVTFTPQSKNDEIDFDVLISGISNAE